MRTKGDVCSNCSTSIPHNPHPRYPLPLSSISTSYCLLTSRVLSIKDLPIVNNIVLGQMVRRSTQNFLFKSSSPRETRQWVFSRFELSSSLSYLLCSNFYRLLCVPCFSFLIRLDLLVIFYCKFPNQVIRRYLKERTLSGCARTCNPYPFYIAFFCCNW